MEADGPSPEISLTARSAAACTRATGFLSVSWELLSGPHARGHFQQRMDATPADRRCFYPLGSSGMPKRSMPGLKPIS